jgi:hypothetical protein
MISRRSHFRSYRFTTTVALSDWLPAVLKDAQSACYDTLFPFPCRAAARHVNRAQHIPRDGDCSWSVVRVWPGAALGATVRRRAEVVAADGAMTAPRARASALQSNGSNHGQNCADQSQQPGWKRNLPKYFMESGNPHGFQMPTRFKAKHPIDVPVVPTIQMTDLEEDLSARGRIGVMVPHEVELVRSRLKNKIRATLKPRTDAISELVIPDQSSQPKDGGKKAHRKRQDCQQIKKELPHRLTRSINHFSTVTETLQLWVLPSAFFNLNINVTDPTEVALTDAQATPAASVVTLSGSVGFPFASKASASPLLSELPRSPSSPDESERRSRCAPCGRSHHAGGRSRARSRAGEKDRQLGFGSTGEITG